VPAGNDDYLYRLFHEKLHFSDFGARTAQVLIQRPFEILVILVGAMILSRIGARLVRRSVQGVVARSAVRTEGAARATGRAETLGGVAASLVRIVVWTIAVLLIIDKLGINPGPVLAGASIVGVAVGFGAQSLVKDFVSGFFMLAEDQFGVGDGITVLDVTGSVEEVNLRVTRLRTSDGTVWFIPNGEIRKVGNSAKEWSRAVVDVTIPADADVDAANAAITEEASAFVQDGTWRDVVLEPPEVLGVESVSPSDTTLRVAVKTKPGEGGRVARELRGRIARRLRRDGIVPRREPASDASASG
jgi:moderate conductance mechanosensitive channel